MRVISLGWGVQSFTLAAMAALGDIEPVDAAIHADTTHERSATYTFAAKWTPWLEERGVRVVTVNNPQPRITTDRQGGKIWIPAYTGGTYKIAIYDRDYDSDYDAKDLRKVIGEREEESQGQLRRQCTHRWKVQPIRRWLQANRNGQPVTQLLGISLDEWHRAKDSDVKYISHQWPLLDLNMTRSDCMNYLESHGLEVPGKSSCTFCPYHNKRSWQDMKREDGPDWAEAVAVDEAIRKVRSPYDLFVHNSRKPLVDVDLSTPEDHGQLRLLNDECDSGYCFL